MEKLTKSQFFKRVKERALCVFPCQDVMVVFTYNSYSGYNADVALFHNQKEYLYAVRRCYQDGDEVYSIYENAFAKASKENKRLNSF